MNAQTTIDLTREAMMMCLIIGAPVLLVGMAVGLLIGFLQALTQVQDQTAVHRKLVKSPILEST